MSEILLRPGLRQGNYPQKQDNGLTEFEQRAALLFKKLSRRFVQDRYSQHYIVNKIAQFELNLKQCSEESLTIEIEEIREKLQRFGLKENLIVRAFAIIRETAERTLGKRHFDEQLFGGWLMINGMLAEMETGEGKTLATTLPACTAAMAGIPVHVITANDYLAARDAEIMQPLYQRLGLQGGSVIDGMETEQRRTIYKRHIVHTTNKQIAFDYLRDRIEIGEDLGPLKFKFRQVQRELKQNNNSQLLVKGLCFALIDEADTVLIDEARTPLIITKKSQTEGSETYSHALYMATSLVINDDYTVDLKTRAIEFTFRGENKLASNMIGLPKLWQNKRKLELLVKQALTAQYFYKKNKHYIVQDDKVQIVDELTGRIMADRSWEQGLHQMIEAKEGCLISDQREALARISYQSFFSRYLRLAGTSGTLKEVAAEMYSVYGLQTRKVCTHQPSKRIMMEERIFRTTALKQDALIKRIAEMYKSNRPVLIGTTTIAESEEVSAWLNKAGFRHRVLNASQDKNEAEIIAKAGQPKAITVATNMAGRGTDIALGLGVALSGGLHVITLSSNDSRRVDRQLYGRCARQGDPGSAEAILCLEDPSLQHAYSSAMLKLFSKICSEKKPIPNFLQRLILRAPQRRNEKNQRNIRKQVMNQDRHLSNLMAFSGKFE